MAAVCIIKPKVNGEDSLLYTRLYEFTNKNRSLTNYLYALASLDEMKLKAGADNMNSQGEISPDYLIKELNLNEYISNKAKINNAMKELGAIGRGGSSLTFNTVDEIIDRVVKFNDDPSNKQIVAVIKQTDDGLYNIVIEPKDDTNFTINNRYKAGVLQLQRVLEEINKLNSNGVVKLNTSNISTQGKRALNITNAHQFVSLIRSFRYAFSKDIRVKPIILSENLWRLLYDLRSDTDLAKRLYSNFGDDLFSVLKTVMSGLFNASENSVLKQDILDRLNSETDIGKNNLDDINKFANLLNSIFKNDKINLQKLENDLKSMYSGLTSELDSIIGKFLLRLYSKYKLDKDTYIKANKELNTIGDVIDGIIASLNTSIDIMNTRGISENDPQRKAILNKLNLFKRDLKQKEKAKAIISFLQDISKFVDGIDALLHFDEQYTDIKNLNVETINRASSQILYIKDRVNFFLPIIKKLTLDVLSQNSIFDDVTDDDRKKIQELAGKALTILNNIEDLVIGKQFDLVESFLLKYWGDENGQIVRPDGTIVVLADLMKTGNGPLNIFDRSILSMTEVHDEVLSTFALSIKSMHVIRDEQMQSIAMDIRRAANDLGGDTRFMFKRNGLGKWFIDNDIDWDRYYKEKREYRESLKRQKLSRFDILSQMEIWENEHLGNYEFEPIEINGETIGIYQRDKDGLVMLDKNGKPINLIIKGMPIYRKEVKLKDSLNNALLKYYYKMMDMKLNFDKRMEEHGVVTNAFNPPQITSSFADNLQDKSFDELVKFLKDKFIDSMKIREDETSYGVQDIDELTDVNGATVRSLPVFYMESLKDLDRLSMDFSRGMLAYSGMAVNFLLMADRVSVMELSKDFLMNRLVKKSIGGRSVVRTAGADSKNVRQSVTVSSSETNIGDWLIDIMDAKFYGKLHKIERKVFGKDASLMATTLTQYTSATGLGANLPGAIANMLVGKLQMLIETNSKEFFGYGDYRKAIQQYWLMIPDIMKDTYSNNRLSKLGLLMDKFDVLGDFYSKIKSTGLYKSNISKIVGNSSLFFMYGMGEHLLHAQTMLAVLNNIKVYNSDNQELSLFDIFDVEKDDANARIVLKEGYKTKDLKTGQEVDVNMDYLMNTIKGRILYANNSMHGAFNEDDKGLVHMWALGRLFMNFRQWMPAHYARRFNTLHWDATLGDYREGYYVTCWNFVKDLAKDLKDHKANILTQYKSLNRWQKANMRRTLAEVAILTVLAALSKLEWGDDPDNRTWATAMLRLLAKRLYMETSASVPVNIFSPLDFFNNIMNIALSPAAAINTVSDWIKIIDIPTLVSMRRLEGGSHKGELVYIRNIERAIPYYDQVYKWLHMASDNDLFVMFNRKMF